MQGCHLSKYVTNSTHALKWLALCARFAGYMGFLAAVYSANNSFASIPLAFLLWDHAHKTACCEAGLHLSWQCLIYIRLCMPSHPADCDRGGQDAGCGSQNCDASN